MLNLYQLMVVSFYYSQASQTQQRKYLQPDLFCILELPSSKSILLKGPPPPSSQFHHFDFLYIFVCYCFIQVEDGNSLDRLISETKSSSIDVIPESSVESLNAVFKRNNPNPLVSVKTKTTKGWYNAIYVSNTLYT